MWITFKVSCLVDTAEVHSLFKLAEAMRELIK